MVRQGGFRDTQMLLQLTDREPMISRSHQPAKEFQPVRIAQFTKTFCCIIKFHTSYLNIFIVSVNRYF